jgi:hypothetical protein
MEAILIAHFFYQSAFTKIAYQSFDVEYFPTIELCEEAKTLVLQEIVGPRFDIKKVSCKKIGKGLTQTPMGNKIATS